NPHLPGQSARRARAEAQGRRWTCGSARHSRVPVPGSDQGRPSRRVGDAVAAGARLRPCRPPDRRRRSGPGAEPPHRDSCQRRSSPRRAVRQTRRPLMLRLPSFTYLGATTVDEAVRRITEAGPDGMVVAGGTDLYPNMKRRQFEPKVLVGLRAIRDLGRISGDRGKGMTLGAGVTLADLVAHPEIAGA